MTSRPATCPLCGTIEAVVLYDVPDRCSAASDRYTVVACPRCGLGFLAPMPTPEQMAAAYPSSYYSYGIESSRTSGWIGWLKRKRADRNSLPGALVRRYFARLNPAWAMALDRPPGARILDVGCGSGSTLQIFKIFGWDPYGVEISSEACRRAQEAGLSEVRCGSLRQAAFPPNFFDLVLLSHVLEHVSDPIEVMREVQRVLRPGGEAVIFVPNAAGLSAKLFGRYRYGIDAPRHLWHFQTSTLCQLVRRAAPSLQIIRLRTRSEPKEYLLSWRFQRDQDANRPYAMSDASATWDMRLGVALALPVIRLADALGNGTAIELRLRKPLVSEEAGSGREPRRPPDTHGSAGKTPSPIPS